jgi:predicted nucleotide-binding protein
MASFEEIADQLIIELARQTNEGGRRFLISDDVCRSIGITNSIQIKDFTNYLEGRGWIKITNRAQQLSGAFVEVTHEGQIYVEKYLKRPKENMTNPTSEKAGITQKSVDPKKVFVVHGRNAKLRQAMFEFLRSIGLHPMEWSEASRLTGKPAPYIGEILEAAFKEAQAIVVLLTGDDEAKLRKEHLDEHDAEFERELTPQARPNVLFEAGLAFGTHPDRTLLVQIGRLRPFSDVAGRAVVRLTNDTEKRQELAQKLKAAGCAVNLEGTDWHKAGDFLLK